MSQKGLIKLKRSIRLITRLKGACPFIRNKSLGLATEIVVSPIFPIFPFDLVKTNSRDWCEVKRNLHGAFPACWECSLDTHWILSLCSPFTFTLWSSGCFFIEAFQGSPGCFPVLTRTCLSTARPVWNAASIFITTLEDEEYFNLKTPPWLGRD